MNARHLQADSSKRNVHIVSVRVVNRRRLNFTQERLYRTPTTVGHHYTTPELGGRMTEQSAFRVGELPLVVQRARTNRKGMLN